MGTVLWPMLRSLYRSLFTCHHFSITFHTIFDEFTRIADPGMTVGPQAWIIETASVLAERGQRNWPRGFLPDGRNRLDDQLDLQLG